ncbi:hypothetical protein D2A34_19585 [Clostridium chromiireducens]|uniref:Uncharacterized protein n=1 Tax=Clostridium chromiireducens TaxID=225345 RepID=A0A399IJ64_9CLOT|nr:hypothetical protein [Clostridium chromiireducens]RII33035.1 hypothetical protein D2A34_19585 [Clostridium chromiireducens]
MGKYKVSFNEKSQSITMDLSGYFSDNDAIAFVNDFIKISTKVKTADTYLILDSGKLLLYPCEAKVKLKAVFELYKQSGYKLVRIKLFKPQKELARKLEELAKLVGLNLEILFIDKLTSDNGKQIKI